MFLPADWSVPLPVFQPTGVLVSSVSHHWPPDDYAYVCVRAQHECLTGEQATNRRCCTDCLGGSTKPLDLIMTSSRSKSGSVLSDTSRDRTVRPSGSHVPSQKRGHPPQAFAMIPGCSAAVGVFLPMTSFISSFFPSFLPCCSSWSYTTCPRTPVLEMVYTSLCEGLDPRTATTAATTTMLTFDWSKSQTSQAPPRIPPARFVTRA